MPPTPTTLTWLGGTDGCLRLLDQTLLPTEIGFRDCRTVEEVWEAIKQLRVRGAPAIGIAAAMGIVLGVQSHNDSSATGYLKRVHEVADYLRSSRPTAVNLFWATERMERVAEGHVGRAATIDPAEVTRRLLHEALAIEEEDRRMCYAIGRAGAELIGEDSGEAFSLGQRLRLRLVEANPASGALRFELPDGVGSAGGPPRGKGPPAAARGGESRGVGS